MKLYCRNASFLHAKASQGWCEIWRWLCFQEFKDTTTTTPISRQMAPRCHQSYNQALNLHPRLNLIIPACQRKRNSLESLLIFSFSLRYFLFLLTIYKRWVGEKFRSRYYINIFYGKAKIFIGCRHSESTGFASVSVPLKTSGEPVRLERWSSIRAGLDVCFHKELCKCRLTDLARSFSTSHSLNMETPIHMYLQFTTQRSST